MNVPLWVTELATAFWRVAGDPGKPPRDLTAAAHRFPLSIVPLASLCVSHVTTWLRRNDVTCGLHVPDQALHACFVARVGMSLIFLNTDDSADEQRFSVAHEVSHFLLHYWAPRRKAVRRIGAPVLEVFDGRRAPTSEECLRSVLREVPIGFHVHLLACAATDVGGRARVHEAEQDADRLAYELLAPAARVAAEATDRMTAEVCLRAVYGLPPCHAAAYAAQLFPVLPRDPILARLFPENLSNFRGAGGK